MGMAYWFARRYNLPIEEAFQWPRVWKTFREAFWAFLLPIIILGGIFGGVVTATEGAALAVVAALFIGLVVYRELDLNHLKTAMIDGGVQTAVVMLLVATSALLGTYLTEVQAPQKLARAVSEITTNKWVVLALLNVLFLVLGMFLHSAAAIILVVPVVMPLVNAVGIDPVHFGLIVTINLGIGQQTPPVAERADGGLLHRQGRHVGSHQGQHLFHRRAGSRCCCWSPTCRSPAWGWWIFSTDSLLRGGCDEDPSASASGAFLAKAETAGQKQMIRTFPGKMLQRNGDGFVSSLAAA